MNNALPDSVTYAVVGVGVHGLSTAWHLAMTLVASGQGSGADVIVLDKTGPGAGATGIASKAYGQTSKNGVTAVSAPLPLITCQSSTGSCQTFT